MSENTANKMSQAVNNLALSYSEIPIKTFVREQCQVFTQTENTKKFNLNFEGIQAKEVYNEIISQPSQKKPLTQASSSRRKSKKNCSPSKNAITGTNNLNTLFKAVELGDKDFVCQNFNVENVNITDQFGWSPLMSAACSGHIEIVDFLLKLGANTRIKDKSGLSAIDLALKRNHFEIVNLLKSKATVNNNVKQGNKNQNDCKIKESEDVKEFFCEICQRNFVSTSRKKHESSTVHIFNSKPKIANTFYGIPKQNRGYQMLLNEGWDEEAGLGPDGTGQKYPVKTVLKRDRKGFSESHRKLARVTHFDPNDTRATRSVHKQRNRVSTKRDRKKQLSREASKVRAWRQVPQEQKEMLDYLQKIEEKGVEIVTDRHEVIALDKRRNDDRVGMRALQKQKVDKTWITVGPLLLKMEKNKAEELLKEDQKQCDIEINKIRSDLKVKVNDLRDLEHTPPVPGLMLKPMSSSEMAAMNQVLGKSL